jgi:hypothetical protein
VLGCLACVLAIGEADDDGPHLVRCFHAFAATSFRDPGAGCISTRNIHGNAGPNCGIENSWFARLVNDKDARRTYNGYQNSVIRYMSRM